VPPLLVSPPPPAWQALADTALLLPADAAALLWEQRQQEAALAAKALRLSRQPAALAGLEPWQEPPPQMVPLHLLSVPMALW
jgi:uncharacterized membrane protein